MRVVVHGGTLHAEHRRLAMAAAGLSLRGHDVRWLGSTSWPEPDHPHLPIRVESGWRLLRMHADVAIGGDRFPERVAFAAWLTRAHAMIIALEGDRAWHWNGWRRWCWESVEAAAMASTETLERNRERSNRFDPARLLAWSESPPPERPEAAHPDVEALERACERLLARRRAGSTRRAAFLDRDGTLIAEKGYVSRASDVELLPEVPEALRVLAAAGYALVVISNQSGVARGYFTEAAVFETTARLRRELRAEGVELDALYFCPHHPEDGCRCRKPGTELLERAAGDLRLALRESAMIGDKAIDVLTGHHARALGVLVRSGYGREEERRFEDGARTPDGVFEDLLQAAQWLAARSGEWPD
jgi:D-glycero-D-manno-heptose 1,7-bisphosphate phosphatase